MIYKTLTHRAFTYLIPLSAFRGTASLRLVQQFAWDARSGLFYTKMNATSACTMVTPIPFKTKQPYFHLALTPTCFQLNIEAGI